MKMKQTTKIGVAFVHDIEGVGLENDIVEKVDIMHLTARNADKRGNIGSQVQLGMHLDGAFASAMLRPPWYRSTNELNCCRGKKSIICEKTIRP